jgi:hypothetical protein
MLASYFPALCRDTGVLTPSLRHAGWRLLAVARADSLCGSIGAGGWHHRRRGSQPLAVVVVVRSMHLAESTERGPVEVRGRAVAVRLVGDSGLHRRAIQADGLSRRSLETLGVAPPRLARAPRSRSLALRKIVSTSSASRSARRVGGSEASCAVFAARKPPLPPFLSIPEEPPRSRSIAG